MKKILGITFGGLQKKTFRLVLSILAAAILVAMGIFAYQNRMLSDVVSEARTEQQKAISQKSKEMMDDALEESLVQTTALQARIADNDLAEVVTDLYTLQSIAAGLFKNSAVLEPIEVIPPDPAMEGLPSAMVLCEAGVDPGESELVGIAAHMGNAMLAMFSNSDKIAGCYIGLADGTDFCVDDHAGNKFNARGELIPFPVRERPWYTGAVETGGLYFTGLIRDAFSGKPSVTCSVPVVVDGELRGVVGIDLVMDSMNELIEGSAERGRLAYVINGEGQVIFCPEKRGIFSIDITDQGRDLNNIGNEELSAFVDQALCETTDLTTVTVSGKQYYMAGSPLPTAGWAVLSVMDKSATERSEKQLLAEYDRINRAAGAKFNAGTAKTRKTSLWMLAAMIAFGALAAMFASRRIVKPIVEMTDDIIRAGQTGESFEMKDSYRTNDEIEVLAAAFDDLSRKTRQYIRNITEITKEKERITTELTLAKELQASMLPHIFPPFPERSEFDLYATMTPAREVGGDFYDYFLIDDDHLCLVMADVSGKGIPAALFMMISKTILQSCAMLGIKTAEILTKTNEALCSNNQVEMFVTVWLGILEISTGRLTAANAGHEYPVLKRPDGGFELLKDKHGLVIGAMDGMKYQEYVLQLEPGSKLFLYTDGVPEATDVENGMFGTARMLEALNAEPDAGPEKLLENVREAVDDFVIDAEQFDDLTMLCLQYNGPGAGTETV